MDMETCDSGISNSVPKIFPHTITITEARFTIKYYENKQDECQTDFPILS